MRVKPAGWAGYQRIKQKVGKAWFSFRLWLWRPTWLEQITSLLYTFVSIPALCLQGFADLQNLQKGFGVGFISLLAPNGSSGKSDTWAVTPGSLHNKWREDGTLGGESVVLFQIRTCALKVFITLHQPEQDGSFSSSDRIACDSHLHRLTLSLRMFVV